MLDIHESLTAWRRAAQALDTTPRDATDWDDAQEAARQARLVYQAMIAQAEARYAEPAAASTSSWWSTLGRTRGAEAR